MERLTERAEVNKCPGIWVKEKFANNGWKTWFNGYDEGYSAINKCAEYEDLEEQRKLLKLPCAVGDTVYYRYDEIKIAPMRVEEIIIAKYETALLLDYCGDEEQLKHWKVNIESTAIDCKIIFLTREEAEAALKEL